MTLVVSTFSTSLRAASVALLTAYKASAGIKLQIYPGRPRNIFPPSAWVDALRDTIEFTGTASFMQHTGHSELVVVHGLFDSLEAVTQRDTFEDAFVSWIRNNRDAFDPRGSIGHIDVADVPNFTPDWVPEIEQTTYYATLITLEGWLED
jgi:hypothetical protein